MHFQLSINLFILIALTQLAKSNLAQNELFKMNKLNLVWAKAQHSLGPAKIKDLKGELMKHELDELNLKKMKANNQDKDGLFEAAVRKRLLSIMAKYNLDRYYDDVHPPIEEEHDLKKDNLKKVSLKQQATHDTSKMTFKDKKLDKLWKKAEESGFSQEQLMVLHEEFQHQQDKLDQHYDAINSAEAQNDRMENSIEVDISKSTKRNKAEQKESASDKKARLEHNIHQDLKEKYKGIKKDIDKLHKKVVDQKLNDHDGPFEEAKVNNLWLAAKQAKFSEDELKSLKEELEHYEVRIKKLKHFENQLERNKLGAKESKGSGDEDHEYKHIRKRVKDLTSKVDKAHKTLEKKILNKSEEL